VNNGNKSLELSVSTNKPPPNLALIEIDSVPLADPSPASLSTELSLGFRCAHRQVKLPHPKQVPAAELDHEACAIVSHQAIPRSLHAQASMAYQRADPHPFTPRGFHPMEIHHRELMAHAVLNCAPTTHEDFTIVTMAPLPSNPLHFEPIMDILQEFLEDHKRIEVREIQPSHLRQALVRLVNVHDRYLVNTSPHQFGDMSFNIVRHNQDRNWRALNFNRDCWLMLSGFPLDHWNHASIQSTIGSFGCVILWENDLDYRARLLVRARVTELEEVIHYIMISESNDLIGQS
jgi:hypothetical protein